MYATESRTHKGLSLIELVIAVTITLILMVAFFIVLNPPREKAEARDIRRIADISMLDRIISEYYLDNERYPDPVNTLRISTSLPSGGITLDNSQGGWILQNLSEYSSRLPLDPYNDENFYYTYYHDAFSYELNARLEELQEEAQNDGGDDPSVYEIGNNLELINP